MRTVCWPVAVLLVSAALCLDVEPALSRRENTAVLRRQKWKSGFSFKDLVERKVKRSEESVGESCHSLQDYEARLQEDTHTVSRVCSSASGEHAVLW